MNIKIIAIEKLKNELRGSRDGSIPAKPIVDYLISKCEKDSDFAERVNVETKTLKDCIQHIFKEARKKIKGSSGYLEDIVVYKMAESYFTDGEGPKSNKKIEPIKQNVEQKTEEKKTELQQKPKPKKNEFEQYSLFDVVG